MKIVMKLIKILMIKKKVEEKNFIHNDLDYLF